MKKFWLSVEQRQCIINSLFSETKDLERESREKPPSLSIVELIEQKNQERLMLIRLFEIGDHER